VFGIMILQIKSVILNKIVENVLFGSGFKKLRFENVEKSVFLNCRLWGAFLKRMILNAKIQF
jgi:hypothetical protein